MSETVTDIGTLIPVRVWHSVEETCKNIMAEVGVTELGFYKSYRECMEGECDGEYYVTDTDVYKVEYVNLEEEDIFIATKNPNSTISFITKYNNGGCGFSEALDEALENMKEK